MAVAVKVAAEGGISVLTQRRPGTGNDDIVRELDVSVRRCGVAAVDLVGKSAQLQGGGDADGILRGAGAGEGDVLIFVGDGNGLRLAVVALADLERVFDVPILLHAGDRIGVFADFGQGVSFVLIGRKRFTGRIFYGHGTALRIGKLNRSADRDLRQRQRLRLGVTRNRIAVELAVTNGEAV